MEYFVIEPEVAGGWGHRTEFTRTPGQRVIVHRLHYEFQGWLGDELLTSFPCFIVTKTLADRLVSAGLRSFELDEVEVSCSALFLELYPTTRLPPFVWLKIAGTAGEDDFGISTAGRLVVSERALTILQQGQLSHCSVSEFEPAY